MQNNYTKEKFWQCKNLDFRESSVLFLLQENCCPTRQVKTITEKESFGFGRIANILKPQQIYFCQACNAGVLL